MDREVVAPIEGKEELCYTGLYHWNWPIRTTKEGQDTDRCRRRYVPCNMPTQYTVSADKAMRPENEEDRNMKSFQ